MTTTRKPIWVTCAALALLGRSPVGVALPPTETPELTLHIAGSTIWDNNFVTVLNSICKDAPSSYIDGDETGKGTYWKAWFCTIDSTKVVGLGVDRKTLILKRNKNGMITGVAPLLETTKPIKFMGIGNTDQCTETVPNSYTCKTSRSGDLIDASPDVGVLDIDPYLMYDSNYTKKIDGVAFKQPDPERMKKEFQVTNAGGVVQNTPVSLNLYRALQAAQVAEGKLGANCLGAVDYESLACMPSLDKSFLTKVFSGQLSRWSEVIYKDKPLTQYAQTPLDTDVVHVCRRNKGASTQAAINSYFLQNPCSTSGGTPVEISNPLFGPVVVAPGQVTEEEKCLDDFSAGTNNSGLNVSGRAWAVGMLTSERNTTFKYQYRYIKIDGIEPSVAKVFSGEYPYFSEAAFAWRKTAPKLQGDLLVLAKKIAADATTPALFGTLNAKIVQPFGNGAFIATAGQGYTAPPTFDPALPVTPYTHQPSGQLLNNCILPVRQQP